MPACPCQRIVTEEAREPQLLLTLGGEVRAQGACARTACKRGGSCLSQRFFVRTLGTDSTLPSNTRGGIAARWGEKHAREVARTS